MLIMLFVSPFNGAFSQCQECAVVPKEQKIFDIMLEIKLSIENKSTKFGKKKQRLFCNLWLLLL